MKKNIFLTGAPSAGKTTVIKKVIAGLAVPAKGFYTEEERVDGKRIGFVMHALDGNQAYLAHQDIQSKYHIRRYGVSIPNIEKVAIPSIFPTQGHVIIIDEIGKMECFSEKFLEAALAALNSPNIVVGTIPFGGTDDILQVKQRDDIEITEVTPENRDQLPDIIIRQIYQVLAKISE